MAVMTAGLRTLRTVSDASHYGAQRGALLDAALASLSGRIRLDEASDRVPEDVIAEILDKVLADWLRRLGGDPQPDPEDDSGKVPAPARG